MIGGICFEPFASALSLESAGSIAPIAASGATSIAML